MHSVYSLVFINRNIKYVFWQCFKICYKSFLFVNSFGNFCSKKSKYWFYKIQNLGFIYPKWYLSILLNIFVPKSKILVLFIQNCEYTLSDIIRQNTFCIINIMFNGAIRAKKCRCQRVHVGNFWVIDQIHVPHKLVDKITQKSRFNYYSDHVSFNICLPWFTWNKTINLTKLIIIFSNLKELVFPIQHLENEKNFWIPKD